MSESYSAFISASLVWNSYVSTLLRQSAPQLSPRVTSLLMDPSWPDDAPRHFCDYSPTLKGIRVNLRFLISSVLPLLLPHFPWNVFPAVKLRLLTWLRMAPRHPVVVLASPQRTRSDIPLCINENWSRDVTQTPQPGRGKVPLNAVLETPMLQELEIVMLLQLEKQVWENSSGRKPGRRGQISINRRKI